MLKFDKQDKYKIGVLKQDSDPLDSQPDFSPRKPQPVVLAGQQLSDMGCNTLQDYLNKNPHQFPLNKTVHCYKIDEGQHKYFDEGQPMPPMNLDDNTKSLNFFGNQNNDKTVDILEKQVKTLEADKKGLEIKLEEERIKLLSRETEWLNEERKFEKEITELKTQVKIFETMIDGFKEGRSLNDDGGGFGNKLLGLLNGPLGNALATVIGHNEKVQGSVGKIINSIASMVPGGDDETPELPTANPTNQPQPQTNVLNNGVTQI